ncbi:hypothetical protein C8R46DRAFT_1031616 [Mycena filopes]|nr:hypothetical protein C8R46DRAFT_1031616 [Mycena filopes]
MIAPRGVRTPSSPVVLASDKCGGRRSVMREDRDRVFGRATSLALHRDRRPPPFIRHPVDYLLELSGRLSNIFRLKFRDGWQIATGNLRVTAKSPTCEWRAAIVMDPEPGIEPMELHTGLESAVHLRRGGVSSPTIPSF